MVLISIGGCSDDATTTKNYLTAGADQQGTGGTSNEGAAGGTNTGGSAGASNGSAGMAQAQTGGTGGVTMDAAAVTDEGGPSDAASNSDAPVHYTHRALLGTSHQGPLEIIADDGTVEWQYDYQGAGLGDEANDPWILPNGDIVFGYVNGAEQLTKDKKVVWKYPAPSGSEIQSAYPLDNGHTLVGETHNGGIGYLRELDSTGTVVSSVTVNSGNAGLGTHAQWRAIRKTPQGTYLVTYLGMSAVRELDATGKTMHEFSCGTVSGEGGFVAVRLPNLNTLIACGDSSRVIEVDPQDKIVWEANKSNVPGNLLTGFACGISRLPSGNTIICSWPGHLGQDPRTSRCFEVTPDHKVVWELKPPDNVNVGWVTSLEPLDTATKVQGQILR